MARLFLNEHTLFRKPIHCDVLQRRLVVCSIRVIFSTQIILNKFDDSNFKN
jgi:hypothetical protein